MAQDGRKNSLIGAFNGLVGRKARRDSDEEAQDALKDQELIGASDVSSSPELVRSIPASSPKMVSPKGSASQSSSDFPRVTAKGAAPKITLFEPDGSRGQQLLEFPFDHSKITFRPGVPGMAAPEQRLERFGKIGRRPRVCNEFEAHRREYPNVRDTISCEISFEVADYYKDQIRKLKYGRNAEQTSSDTPSIIVQFETYRNGTMDEMPYEVAFGAVEHFLSEIQKERKEYLKAANLAIDTDAEMEVTKRQQIETGIDARPGKSSSADSDEQSKAFDARGRAEYMTSLQLPSPTTGSLSAEDWPILILELRFAQTEVRCLSLKVRMLLAENQLSKGNWEKAILGADEVLPVAKSRGDIELIARAQYVKGRAYFGRQDWNAATACFTAAEAVAGSLDFREYFMDDWSELAAANQNLWGDSK